MSPNFLDILVLLGAIQGFVVSAILLFSKKTPGSNRLLGLLLLIMSLASLNVYLINQQWFNQNQVLMLIHEIIPMVVIMPAGPLIYFYCRSFMDGDFVMTKADRKQFYTIILDLLPHLVVIIYIIGILTGKFKPTNPVWGNFIDDYNTYVDIPRWVSLTIYLWLSYKYLRLNKIKIKGIKNNLKSWPSQLILAFSLFQLIWLIHLIPYVIPTYSEKLLNLVGWYPVYIPISILIYWLSIRSYQLIHQNFAQAKKTRGLLNGMSVEAIHKAIKVLIASMEKEQLFLDPELNLNGLATHTGLSPKQISAILSQELNTSFSVFVNEYRIREIKNRMMQQNQQNFTIAGIAFDCGFNSQPTFQRVFKTFTGLTPTEFMNNSIQKKN